MRQLRWNFLKEEKIKIISDVWTSVRSLLRVLSLSSIVIKFYQAMIYFANKTTQKANVNLTFNHMYHVFFTLSSSIFYFHSVFFSLRDWIWEDEDMYQALLLSVVSTNFFINLINEMKFPEHHLHKKKLFKCLLRALLSRSSIIYTESEEHFEKNSGLFLIFLLFSFSCV